MKTGYVIFFAIVIAVLLAVGYRISLDSRVTLEAPPVVQVVTEEPISTVDLTVEEAPLPAFEDEIIVVKAPEVRTYTVVSGDTLWKIAKAELGFGSDWPKLWEANRDQVPDPDLIFPGQVLIIPV